MPWEVLPVSELRLAFVHQVVTLHRSVPRACADFRISRKTGYKWLRRYRERATDGLNDVPRRPHRSPARSADDTEAAILRVRDTSGWGPRKIHAYLKAETGTPCCIRTVANILRRRGRVGPRPRAEPAPVQFFERSRPNELWPCDFKGPLEVGRRTVDPFTVVDDHSRDLLAVRPGTDKTMATAFAALWAAFGAFGLPERMLCDNGFGSPRPEVPGVSWFEARLIRLGIATSHGRAVPPPDAGEGRAAARDARGRGVAARAARHDRALRRGRGPVASRGLQPDPAARVAGGPAAAVAVPPEPASPAGPAAGGGVCRGLGAAPRAGRGARAPAGLRGPGGLGVDRRMGAGRGPGPRAGDLLRVEGGPVPARGGDGRGPVPVNAEHPPLPYSYDFMLNSSGSFGFVAAKPPGLRLRVVDGC